MLLEILLVHSHFSFLVNIKVSKIFAEPRGFGQKWTCSMVLDFDSEWSNILFSVLPMHSRQRCLWLSFSADFDRLLYRVSNFGISRSTWNCLEVSSSWEKSLDIFWEYQLRTFKKKKKKKSFFRQSGWVTRVKKLILWKKKVFDKYWRRETWFSP